MAGCAFNPEASPTGEMQAQARDAVQAQIDNGLARANSQVNQPPRQLVSNSDQPWVNPRVIKRQEPLKAARVPKELEFPVAVDQGEPVELSVLTSHITNMLRDHSPVTLGIAPDLMEESLSGGGAGAAPGASKEKNMITIQRYSGPLNGLLDIMASRLNMSWSYTRGQVLFSKYVSKTFAISSVVGDSDVTASINGSSAGSGSTSSSSGQTIKTSYKLDIWKDIEKNVKPMLSSKGKMAISDTLGTITVTDTPDVVRNVENYISNTNDTITRQVSIIVQVYTVTQNAADNYGIDWKAVWQNAGSGLGLTIGGAPSGLSSTLSPSLSVNVLAGASPWATSQAMFSALSTQGLVAQAQDIQMVTLNNQPVPITNVEKTPYISKITPGVVSNGVVTQPSVEQGEINAGYVMNVTPRVLNTDDVMLTFSLDVTSLKDMKTVDVGSGSGATKIQQPVTDTRSYMHRSMLRSGQTLVLSGLQKMYSKKDKTGLLSADNWKMGGKFAQDYVRETTVVLITPVVMNRSQYSTQR